MSLSPSQNLYTRRGTLVGLSGKADNVRDYLIRHSYNVYDVLSAKLRQVVSTLSVLEPFRRAVVGTPFLYQKVRSMIFTTTSSDILSRASFRSLPRAQ